MIPANRSARRSRLVVWGSPLGAIGVVEGEGGVTLVRIGYPDPAALADELSGLFPAAERIDWSGTAELLARYAEGEVIAFDGVRLEDGDLTPFRRRVIHAARAVPYGATSNYSELAHSAGSPRACRAAGSTMATNRWPIIVPCHRILAKGGGLGGYSAPTGLGLKERLLEMERACAGFAEEYPRATLGARRR